jgi:hypothetical protein
MLDRHCVLFAVSIQPAADNERQRERQTQMTLGSMMNDAVRQEPLTTWRAVYFARTFGVFSDNETASSNPGQARLYPRWDNQEWKRKVLSSVRYPHTTSQSLSWRHFFTTHFNIIHPPKPRPSTGSLASRFSKQSERKTGRQRQWRILLDEQLTMFNQSGNGRSPSQTILEILRRCGSFVNAGRGGHSSTYGTETIINVSLYKAFFEHGTQKTGERSRCCNDVRSRLYGEK